MKKEIRTVVYDEELRLEAYRFEGIAKPWAELRVKSFWRFACGPRGSYMGILFYIDKENQ